MTVAAPSTAKPAGAKLLAFAADIKLSHSVFALPFALLAATLAARTTEASWGVWSFVLVVICMVCARTVAMGANRLIDAEGDALNPRTARRALPSGALARSYVAAMIALFAIGFIASAAGFGLIYGNWWPLWLAVPVLGFLAVYPWLKRFTALCHYYLGAALGLGAAKLLYKSTNFNAAGFLPGFDVTWNTMFLGGVIAMLLMLASGIIPATRAARLPVVTALRGVE